MSVPVEVVDLEDFNPRVDSGEKEHPQQQQQQREPPPSSSQPQPQPPSPPQPHAQPPSSSQPHAPAPPSPRSPSSPPVLLGWKGFESELKCPLCREFFDGPVSLKCTHVFCSLCMRRHMEMTAGNCPSCRASSTASDFRVEQVVAGLVKRLRMDNFRKTVRASLRGGDGRSAKKESKNATFVRQRKLEELSMQAKDRKEVERVIQPMYKNIKDKEMREVLFGREGLYHSDKWSRDEMVKNHKELILMLQATNDGIKAGCYQAPICKEAVVKLWTEDMTAKYGLPPVAVATGKWRPRVEETVQEAQMVQKATLGSIDFAAMRAKAMANRKRWLEQEEDDDVKKTKLDKCACFVG